MTRQSLLLSIVLMGPVATSAQEPTNVTEEARAAERRGDRPKAIELQERALAQFRQLYPAEKFPDGHVDLARCLQDLGYHYSLRGQPERALPHFREALVMRRKLYPPEQFPDGNFRVANTLQNLGMTLFALGRPNEALAPMQESVAICRKLYPAAK